MKLRSFESAKLVYAYAQNTPYADASIVKYEGEYYEVPAFFISSNTGTVQQSFDADLAAQKLVSMAAAPTDVVESLNSQIDGTTQTFTTGYIDEDNLTPKNLKVIFNGLVLTITTDYTIDESDGTLTTLLAVAPQTGDDLKVIYNK